MKKSAISSDQAPQAIGPYSPAVMAEGHMLFISGQLPTDPETGRFPEGGIKEQTAQSLKNLCTLLAAAGADVNNVVKTTVFLKSMDDFAAMNEVYGKVFSGLCPARSAVEVGRLPKDAMVEIEAIAMV